MTPGVNECSYCLPRVTRAINAIVVLILFDNSAFAYLCYYYPYNGHYREVPVIQHPGKYSQTPESAYPPSQTTLSQLYRKFTTFFNCNFKHNCAFG